MKKNLFVVQQILFQIVKFTKVKILVKDAEKDIF